MAGFFTLSPELLASKAARPDPSAWNLATAELSTCRDSCRRNLSDAGLASSLHVLPIARLRSEFKPFSDCSNLFRKDGLGINSAQRALRKQDSRNSVWQSPLKLPEAGFSYLQAESEDAGSSFAFAFVRHQELHNREKESALRTNAVPAGETKVVYNAPATSMSPDAFIADVATDGTLVEPAHMQPEDAVVTDRNDFTADFTDDLQKDQSLSCLPNTQPSLPPVNVCELTSILDKMDASGEIEQLDCWIKRNCATLDVSFLAELGKRNMWSAMENLLRAEIKLHDKRTLCDFFNKIFQVCATYDAAAWAGKWFHLLLREGGQPDESSFGLLMPLFRRHNLVNYAKFAYQHMIGLGIKSSEASSSMMLLHIFAGDHEEAAQNYEKMQDSNESLLPQFFFAELHSCVGFGNVKQAEQIVKFLQGHGVKLDLFVYNLMIEVNGKSGEYSRAKTWFRYIEEDGSEPDEASYRSIIGACGKAGRLYDALHFYDRMVSLNFLPTVVNYNTLIHLHRKLDHNGRIFPLLSDMKVAGCSPNRATLSSLVKVYERYRRLQKLPEALQLLREAGWEPNEACYKILLRAYIRGNMVEAAMETFDMLCRMVDPDEILCYNLISMCKSIGRHDEANLVFCEMKRYQNITPHSSSLQAAMDAFCPKGLISKGEAL